MRINFDRKHRQQKYHDMVFYDMTSRLFFVNSISYASRQHANNCRNLATRTVILKLSKNHKPPPPWA